MKDKAIRIYKQRGDTCAICCMMMALEYFNLMEKANWYDERRLYKIYGSNYISGTPFSALAYHFSKNGLNTSTKFNYYDGIIKGKVSAINNELLLITLFKYKQEDNKQ